MTQLSNLSEPQLEKRIQETQAELDRRIAVSKATKDIFKILQKYNLAADDLDFKKLFSNSSTKPTRKIAGKDAKRKKNRAKVAPKFQSIDTVQKWTGRGRAPKWVVAFCEAENLTIEDFKKDPRFKI